MNWVSKGLMYDLPQGLYEFWRIIEPGAHFKACETETTRLFPGLVIDFSKSFHVIGNEGHRYHTNFANMLGRQLAQSLVQGRLKPATGPYLALIAKAVRVAPSTAFGEKAHGFFDLTLVRITLFNH